MSDNPAEIVSHTSIPRPAFVLARYISTKCADQLSDEAIKSIPRVLDMYINVC